ncbi:ARM repeat-containing protein [Serendipita vermifera]|nr:ARM repeat-containing protein [Serendipita vermifera]
MQAEPEPPSLQQVFQVLQNAVSQNPMVAQAASQQLDSFKTTPGILQTIHMVAVERTIALDVRKMAILQFKNLVQPQWKRSQGNPENVRQSIRARMFSFLDEPDDIIAQTNGIAMARIARFDYPRSWPDLGTQLLGMIKTGYQTVYLSPNPTEQHILVLRRALSTLNQVLKELTATKVPLMAAAVNTLVDQLREPLLAIYQSASQSFANGLSPDTLASSDKLNQIRICHLSLKCTVKSMVFLWQRTRVKGFDDAAQTVEQFFQTAVDQFIALVNLRLSLFMSNLSSNLLESETQLYISRHVRLFGKYFRKTQAFSTAKFIKMPNCRTLVLFYWERVVQAANSPPNMIHDSETVIFPTRFLTQALLIFKDSVAQWSPARQTDAQDVLSKEFVEEAARLLVKRLLLLDESDLEKWSEDPEEWINIEEGDSDAWEFEIRPCAERVLLTLAIQYGDYVAPLIREYLEENLKSTSDDVPSILQKEALYCAVGRCAHRLRDKIPFDEWIATRLSVEVMNPSPVYRIIKRRIAWLFGKWLTESSVITSKAKIYELLVYLTFPQSEGSDPVVRLTAATALKDCVEAISFDRDIFLPNLPNALKALLQLVDETESQDAKKRVLRSISVVVDAVREQVVPYLGEIINRITVLWQQDIGIPLRAEIMHLVTDLIKASRENSSALAPVSVILIRECLNPVLKPQMEDDALAIWLVTLRNTPQNSDAAKQVLFDLLPIAVEFMATNLDLLGTVCQIMESYLLLDYARVLQLQALPLHEAFLQVYQQALSTNIKDMLSAANLMIQLAPSAMWGEAMHNSTFFAKLLDSVIEDKSKHENSLILVEVLHLFARMIMQDPMVFVQLVAASSSILNQPPAYLMNGFLDQWWAKFDYVADSPRRKLIALATAQLLSTGNEEVVDRLKSMEPLNIWLDVLGELKEALSQRPEGEDEDSPLIRFWKAQDALNLPDRLEEVTETLEMDRRQELFKRDPVRNIPLKEFIQEKMQQAQVAAAANGVDFQKVMSLVDQTTITSLQKQLV